MYLTLLFRCIFFYFFLIFALRFMGKREVGELSIFDIVIYLVMSELLAIAVSDPNESIFTSILPIITLIFLQVSLSYLILKSKKFRDLIDGSPVLIINRGVINQREMRKQRYSIDDLLLQLRNKDIVCIKDVEFAILENNGELSVIKKEDCIVLHPFPLIQDGTINKKVLNDLNKDENWINKQLRKNGYNNYDDIFITFVLKNGFYIIPKEKR